MSNTKAAKPHTANPARQSSLSAMNASPHAQPLSKPHGGHFASVSSIFQRIVRPHSENDVYVSRTPVQVTFVSPKHMNMNRLQSDNGAPDTSIGGRCDRRAALHSTDTSGVAPQVGDGGCAWGGSCVAPLDDQTPAGIQEHLKLYHGQPGWNGNTPTVCRWEGGLHCGHKEMNWGVMGKHIVDRHLGRTSSA